MKQVENDLLVIEAFAKACESLNEYAQQLRRDHVFPQVTTSADIRYLKAGWRLSKFVEAELNASECFWAAWSLELGGDGTQWTVSSSVSVSHTDVFFELDEANASSIEELLGAITLALEHLKSALADHDGFREAVANVLPQ